MLNLPAQPRLHSADYYFFPLYSAVFDQRSLYLRPVSAWTPEERESVRAVMQQCADRMEKEVREAEERGEGVLLKEHTCFMVEPTSWVGLGEATVESHRGTGEEGEAPWTVAIPSHHSSTTPSPSPTSTTVSSSPTTTLTHSPLNTTPLPDAYLLTYRPTFLIRHPSLAFPSYWRIARQGGINLAKAAPQMTLKYTRRLYEFYAGAFGKSLEGTSGSAGGQDGDGDGNEKAREEREESRKWPIVLTADDVMLQPAVLSAWCELSGLDGSKLLYDWLVATDAERAKMHPVGRFMTVSLQDSSGVRREKVGEGLVLAEEVERWRAEFGETEASALERWVRGAMGDWVWLEGRRLRVGDSQRGEAEVFENGGSGSAIVLRRVL